MNALGLPLLLEQADCDDTYIFFIDKALTTISARNPVKQK
jgi:hypothetical protein